MIVHSSEKVTLIYIKSRGLLYFTIVGFTEDDVIKKVATDLNKNKREIKSDKLLVDTSKLGVLRKSDYKIIVDQMLPVFKEVGIKKAALLKTSDIFGLRKINDIINTIGNKKVMIFDDMIVAEKWLLN